MSAQELLFTVNDSVSQEITRIKRLTNLIYINMKLILILQPTPPPHYLTQAKPSKDYTLGQNATHALNLCMT